MLLSTALLLAEGSARVPFVKLPQLPCQQHERLFSTSRYSSLKPLIFSTARGGSIHETFNELVSKENLSTFFASIVLADGIVSVISPDCACNLYGRKIDNESLAGLLAEIIGGINVGTAVAVAMVGRISLSKTVGLSLLPRLLVGIKTFATGKLSKFGLQSKTRLIVGKVCVVVTCISSLILEKGYPVSIIKILALTEVVYGIFATFFPETAAKPANLELASEEGNQSRILFQKLGQDVFSHGLYVGCLVMGCEPTRALGYTSISMAAGKIFTVVTKANEGLGVPSNTLLICAAALCGTAAKLLSFSEGNE